jgi:site-specific DNA-methyltransferase (adenine-specific)
MTLYEELRMPYLQGICETCNNLLSQTMTEELSEIAQAKLQASMQAIRDTDYQKEEIRKALQTAILKGFKHVRRSNADITPDTIGLFVTFLLEKLTKNVEKMMIFDPLVGTGNLLLTVANNLEKEVVPVGVDNNIESYQLAESMFDMMEYEEGLYFQDTFTFKHVIADAIITDFPASKPENGKYFPYEVLKFHHANLQPGGFCISIIPNDFFEVAGNGEFKTVLAPLYQVVGLVTLPDTMFKTMGKSILILQRQADSIKKITKVLVAEIPSFQDPKAVNEAIIRIDAWFKENL